MKLGRYKIYAVLSLIFIALLFPVFFFERKITKDVVINNKTIHVEVADTSAKRIRGLMFRDFLPEDNGMLFVFDSEDYYAFWMLNTKIPLDIVWIDKDNKVVDIESDLQPCSDSCPKFLPTEKAMYVLEVNANYTSENNIIIGDKVNF